MAADQISNSKFEAPNKHQISSSKIYNLEDRTLEFSKAIVKLCRCLPKDFVNRRLGDQLVRSGTSVGANYREANETDTKKDFKNRIRITKKEAKETVYWLQLVLEANPILNEMTTLLLREAREILKITASIYKRTRS